MKEYSLILNSHHINPLLEALRLHRVAIDNSPSSERERAIMADLYKRADLLAAVVDATDDMSVAMENYHHYCEHGDTTTGSATVIPRPL